MKITPDILLAAYAQGLFPMAESRDAGELHWYDPDERGILPLESFHVPRRLAKTIRRNPYRLSCDENFEGVIRACAGAREDTWINDEIIALYTGLHAQGHAHSVEAWQGDTLAGGLYGVSINAAFFGESMFSTAQDASKIALAHLVEKLKAWNYALLDTQFTNDHIRQFGVVTIPRAAYHARLQAALARSAAPEAWQAG